MGRTSKLEGRDRVPRPSTKTNPTPPAPVEDEDEKLQLVHWRFSPKKLNNLETLIEQRVYPRAELYRRIYDLGDRSVSALGPPDTDTGLCGTYQPEQLAKGLLDEVNALIEFEMKHGQIPTIIRLQAERIAELQDIRGLIRAELRLLLHGELKSVLREELSALVRGLPLAAVQEATDASHQNGATNGVLTTLAPGAEAMLEGLFNS
jgi:hypothetical protein